jgi:hypothetical protein
MAKTPEKQPTQSETLKPGKTQLELKNLKQEILKKNFEGAAEMIMNVAADNGGEIPAEKIDKLLRELTPEERKALHGFFKEKETDPKKIVLHQRLDFLQQELGGQKPLEQTKASGKIIEVFQKIIVDRMGPAVEERARSLGYKGDVKKSLEFVMNYFIGAAANMVENLARSFQKFNPDVSSMLTTSLELRLSRMPEAKRKTYEIAYRAWMKTPGFPTPTPDQADAYEKACKVKKDLAWAEFLNTPAQTPAPQVAAAPQAAPTTPEKIEGSKEIPLADNSTMRVTRTTDKKTTVEVAGLKREMKLSGSAAVEELTFTKATGTEKGTMELKLTGGAVKKVDLLTLRDAIRDKKNDLQTIDGTKIDLTA